MLERACKHYMHLNALSTRQIVKGLYWKTVRFTAESTSFRKQFPTFQLILLHLTYSLNYTCWKSLFSSSGGINSLLPFCENGKFASSMEKKQNNITQA